MNGDGRADVVGFSDKCVIVGISTDTRFDVSKWPNNCFPYFTYAQGWVVGRHPRMLVDVNGERAG